MSDQIFWFMSRSSGLLAWLAAAGAMLVGAMIPSRLLGRRPTIPWLTDLHRMLGAMATAFLLIHMGTLWFDHFVAFRLDDFLIPFVADVPGVSRLSLALGVVAAWLLAAVQLTSLIRERLPDRLWRSVHLTSYLILLLGTVHAVLAGSDVGNPIIASIGTSALTAVILAGAVRLRRMRNQARAEAEAAAALDAQKPGPGPGSDEWLLDPRPDEAAHPGGPGTGSGEWLLNPRPDEATYPPRPGAESGEWLLNPRPNETTHPGGPGPRGPSARG